jgi:hypothetical protein
MLITAVILRQLLVSAAVVEPVVMHVICYCHLQLALKAVTPTVMRRMLTRHCTALHARATLQTASAPPSTNGDAAHLDAAAAAGGSTNNTNSNSNGNNSNGDAGASLNGDSPLLNGSASDSASVNGDAAAAAVTAAVAMQTVIHTRMITVTSTELQQRCRCVPGVVPDSAARVVYLVREGELPAASSRSLDEDMCKVRCCVLCYTTQHYICCY